MKIDNWKKQKVSALIVVAHPDDETIFMGGTILRHPNGFGERLQSYAKKHNLQYSFEGAKELFQVFTLLRLSGGQSNNLGANIHTTDSGLVCSHKSDGRIVFKKFPNYDTAIVEPIPILYDKFKRLALENCGERIKEHIGEIERIVELNERYMLQQLG